METLTKLNQCVACGSDDLVLTLDLHDQPLANTYPAHADEDEPYYPLAVNRCRDCYHLQLTHIVDPELISHPARILWRRGFYPLRDFFA